MADVNHIESNVVGLRARREDSFKTVSSGAWEPISPNSFGDFGRTNNRVAREPINDSRQREKPVVVGHDSVANFNTDLTQEDTQPDRFETFFSAALRVKDEFAVAVVDGTADEFDVAANGDDLLEGDLIFAFGFDDDANNGLHVVETGATGTTIPVSSDLVDASGQTGTLRRVGFEFAAGDAVMDVTGTLPQITTTAKDLTELDLVPGELLLLGGDASTAQFETSANNTWARARTIAANALTIDKAGATLAADADGDNSQSIRVFFASRILKNEAASLITKIFDQLERSLGAPDDASPSDIQYEYVEGCRGNTLALNVPSEDKVTLDWGYVAGNTSYIDGPTSRKAGTQPSETSTEGYTSADVLFEDIQAVSQSDENPTPLESVIQESTVSIDNGLTGLKGHGQDGSFAINAGFFSVSVALQVYFADVAALESLKDNDDLTYHLILARQNKGFFADCPLLGGGGDALNVGANEPVLLPLNLEAARGGTVHDNLDHTLMLGWFDYLPDLHMPA